MLYIADTPGSLSNILRYTVSTDTEDLYASSKILPDTSTIPFQFATSLSLDPIGNLFIGDDPTNGVQLLQGHMWQIAAGSAPEVAGQSGQPPAPPATPALTTGQLYADAITSPGGSAMMGGHLWVTDHALGFCRLDPDAPPATTSSINQSFCNISAVSPGQPTFDSVNNFVYVPDNSSKSQGVWRLKFKPDTQTVGSPVKVAGGNGGLIGNKATATALDPNGDLYVGFIKNGNILKVTNPAGAVTSQVVTTIGKTSDGRGAFGFAFVGADLYLAESGAVTVIRNAETCGGTCVAEPVGISAIGPMAIASDGANLLYIVETPNTISSILRFTISTGTEIVFATASDTGTPFNSATGLMLDAAGNLFVGDDPSGGVQILQGHIWKVAPITVP